MAIKLVRRSAWGARAARSAASYLSSTRGVKVHYTGDYVDPALVDHHERCDDRVRSIQNAHMDGNGWNDIGYSALVCAHGYVYVGRGPHALPAANGPGLNSGHYAVCGLLGNKGLTRPTDAMLHGIRDAIEWLRDEGDAGGEIKGHRDGYATDCPGGPLYAWVRAGAPRPKPTPPAPQEDLMKTVVDLGALKPQTIPAGERRSLVFEKEWSDPGHVHEDTDEDGTRYPSIIPKGGTAPYLWTVHLECEGQPNAVAHISRYDRTLNDRQDDARSDALNRNPYVLSALLPMNDQLKYRVDVVNQGQEDLVITKALLTIAR